MHTKQNFSLLSNRSACALLAMVAVCLTSTVHAATLQPGNIIVSVREFTGSTSAPKYVAEVDSITGARVQTIFNVPTPGTLSVPSSDQPRDLVLDGNGNIQLYNGTFNPTLLTYDLAADSFTQTSYAGWSTVNNTSFGGASFLGNRLFLTDMNTGGAPEQGILEVDLTTGSSVRWGTNIPPLDLNVGQNGLVYALDGTGSPRDEVYVYDPATRSQLSVVPLPFDDHRAVAATADGSIFTATWSGDIRRFDASGTQLDILNVPGSRFSDIDIAPDGRIALGTADGDVVFTTTGLDAFSLFQVTDSSLGGDVFVSWQASIVPEPAHGALLLLTLLPVAMRLRKRRK